MDVHYPVHLGIDGRLLPGCCHGQPARLCSRREAEGVACLAGLFYMVDQPEPVYHIPCLHSLDALDIIFLYKLFIVAGTGTG